MKLKIFHMASMARSGETLVQRHLQAHPKVLVTHNLKKKDERNEALLFNYIKRSPHLSISGSSKRLRDYETSGKEVLLVKQGVWEHPFPFRGFILARNPLAIFASLWTYDSMEKGGSPEGNWKYNEERLLRWLGDIDPKLIPGFIDLDPEHQFSTFYNRRMCILLESQLPIIYYEKLVRAPEQEFRRLCSILGIHFDEQVLAAHCRYGPADIGHGQTEMA